MNKDLKNAAEALAKKSAQATTSHEAMQFAQAALNLAQANGVLSNIK
jgi:hypothetical protein